MCLSGKQSGAFERAAWSDKYCALFTSIYSLSIPRPPNVKTINRVNVAIFGSLTTTILTIASLSRTAFNWGEAGGAELAKDQERRIVLLFGVGTPG